MSKRREVDSTAKRYVLGGLGRLAVLQLLAGIALLLVGTIAFNAMVSEIEATRRAARGDGVVGTFTADSKSCSRGGCSWYGTFWADGGQRMVIDGVQLRGEDDLAISAGDTIPALDVGSTSFVHRVGGSPAWGEAVGAGFVAIVVGGAGAGLVAWALWGVHRTRPSRASRGQEAKGRGRRVVRDFASRDRWGWTARPDSVVIRVKVDRPWGRTIAVAVSLIALVSATPLVVAGWFAIREGAGLVVSVASAWLLVLSAVLVTVTIPALRLVLVRPRVWVTEDEIVIWDGLLLWKVLRIPRAGVAAVRHSGGLGRRHADAVQLSPFGDEVNLVLRLREATCLPARRLRWGNWIWVLASSNYDWGPTIPQRGHRASLLRLRVKEPRRVATELDRWLTRETDTPPEPVPVDHVHYGRVRTHRGVGGSRLKVKGRLPQPVLAEFANEGPDALRVSLRRTEFGRGTPMLSCGPGAPPASMVLDDAWVADKALTNRFLHIESGGPWTVTISGPERSRAFTRSVSGHGPEVLTYQGPPGIAVMTCPNGEPHEIHLRGPDLAGLYGRDPAAFAGALRPTPEGESSAPSRSTFAVPSQAVLQVRTNGADWRIDVTPLAQADVDTVSGSGDEKDMLVPPTGRVRPFENSIAGDRAAVVRYLGPPGPVRFRGSDGFGLVRLGAGLAPARLLVPPADDDRVFELRSHALLQVTGGHVTRGHVTRGHGAWSMEEVHDLDLPQ
ncbi:hypothetical protein OHR68_42205 [Spirillospora sp. NBC_00431]